ncbi:MAG: hypothetical protein JXR83_18115 [Deltaproteobacteria bacterium]|nr:hypothetical protein [Deltaproteobacteria bacterium]
MRYRWLANLALSLTALLMLSGCFLFQTGSASTDGKIGGRTISVGATVFCWWDTTVYAIGTGDGEVFRETRDGQNQSLHIEMYGFGFNPREDLRFLSVNDQLELARNMAMHDSLRFVVAASGGVSNGKQLTYTTENQPAPQPGEPYLAAEPRLNLAWIKVNETNEYPDTAKHLGTLRNYTLELKKVSRKAGEAVEGSFEIKVERSANDTGSVVTGQIKGDFTAPVINERIAECNFDDNGAGNFVDDPCDDLEYDGVNP